MKNLILISLIVLLSSSCATTVAVTSRLDCPPPIFLPTLTEAQGAEMDAALSQAISDVLDKREDLLKARIDTLCGIIETTHES